MGKGKEFCASLVAVSGYESIKFHCALSSRDARYLSGSPDICISCSQRRIDLEILEPCVRIVAGSLVGYTCLHISGSKKNADSEHDNKTYRKI